MKVVVLSGVRLVAHQAHSVHGMLLGKNTGMKCCFVAISLYSCHFSYRDDGQGIGLEGNSPVNQALDRILTRLS